MPTYKASLSVDSLTELMKQIAEYGNKVEELRKSLPGKVADRARVLIDEKTPTDIDAADGNLDVSNGTEKSDYKAVAFMEGRQAAYIEFGTGIEGMASPHPKVGEIPWAYNVGTKIKRLKDGELGWVWYEGKTPHFTHGLPALKPVYDAAQTVREELPQIARKELNDG